MKEIKPLLVKMRTLTFAFKGLQANIQSLAVSSKMVGDLYNDVNLEIQKTAKTVMDMKKEIATLKLELATAQKELEKLKPKKTIKGD